MKKQEFINDDFLLESGSAKKLYHEFAENMPIVDFHCHLSPEEIAGNRRWENLAQVWLHGDHYKWRAMRWNGVDERFCTGDASDWEKFEKWAETMPYLLRNPLYHWTHLELARYFGITDRVLSPETAKGIWDECCEKLSGCDLSARGLMIKSGVRLACTTDDPIDSLEHHRAIAADSSFEIQVLPTWRPDKGMAVENQATFNEWVDKLCEVSNMAVLDYSSYLAALRGRHDIFHAQGCRLSDHGLMNIPACDYIRGDIESAFTTVRSGGNLDEHEVDVFKSAMMHEFAIMDHEKGWTQQIHYGVLRNNNSRMFSALGSDTGFDSIGNPDAEASLVRFLDRLDKMNSLPRTILYNINPGDNAALVTIAGSFQDGSIPGKIQVGSGWWFLDQKDGMERQMEALSQMGLLSRFVGMVTDSRSFLSYTRHEYFRRILCNLLGNDIELGLVPDDLELVGGMVKDICYNNSAEYFGFDL